MQNWQTSTLFIDFHPRQHAPRASSPQINHAEISDLILMLFLNDSEFCVSVVSLPLCMMNYYLMMFNRRSDTKRLTAKFLLGINLFNLFRSDLSRSVQICSDPIQSKNTNGVCVCVTSTRLDRVGKSASYWLALQSLSMTWCLILNHLFELQID